MSDFNLFSLEEDDEIGNLFITQEPSHSVSEVVDVSKENESNNREFLGVNQSDFASPCSSLLNKEFQYSDISDDEVFDKKEDTRVEKR